MGKSVYLNVGNRKVMTTQITYDDLIILYRQYIETYHELPISTKCNLVHNMPHRRRILDILDGHGVTIDEFVKQFGLRDKRYKYESLNIGDIVGRWEIIGRAPDTFTPKGQRIPSWQCRCTCGSGIIRNIADNSLKTGNSTSCGCVQRESITKLKGTMRSQSFYDWCIENNHLDFLERWDYELNNKKPNEVSYCSHDWFYFLCIEHKHKSSKYQLTTITCNTTQRKLRCRYCSSFAQRLIDVRGVHALELYWDYEKNIDNPWEIEGSSKVNGVWLKCTDTDYHGSYYIIRDRAIHGGGCPYCAHYKVHPKDSFGQYMIDTYGREMFYKIWDFEKNTIDPFTIAPSTRTVQVWLKCAKTCYHPPSLIYPNDINSKGTLCSYCSGKLVCKEDSLGGHYPDAVEIWSKKNIKSSYEYSPKSNKKVWWSCKDGKHDDYQKIISDAVSSKFRCPNCSYERSVSYLQEKVDKYVSQTYGYTMLHEGYCNITPINPKTNCRLLFDNEIVELKLIIEVHGKQHYEVTGFSDLSARHYNTSPEYELSYLQWKDQYKREYALSQGYSYLEIPYWTEENDAYKIMIDDKIKEILEKAA